MMTNLKFETGKTTCAWKHGNFCKFMGSNSYGTQPFCTLFSKDVGTGNDESDLPGWLQRLPECLALDEPERLTKPQQDAINYRIKRGEFAYLEDGFLYWFPSSGSVGGIGEHLLRTIAQYLEIQNKLTSNSFDKYFGPIKSIEVGPNES
jgi:hypothetical protein